MRNGGSANQSRSTRGGGKWSDCGHIFKEPTRFADVLEGKGGQRGEVRMTPGFWPEQPEGGSCYLP